MFRLGFHRKSGKRNSYPIGFSLAFFFLSLHIRMATSTYAVLKSKDQRADALSGPVQYPIWATIHRANRTNHRAIHIIPLLARMGARVLAFARNFNVMVLFPLYYIYSSLSIIKKAGKTRLPTASFFMLSCLFAPLDPIP